MAQFIKNKKIKYQIKDLEFHSDERGWLVEMLKRNELKEKIKQIYVATIEPGFIRGNHYHLERIEWFFIIGSNANLFLEDVDSREKTCLKASPEKPKVFTVFPKVAHAVKNTGKNTLYLVSAQNTIYNPKNRDTFDYPVCE